MKFKIVLIGQITARLDNFTIKETVDSMRSSNRFVLQFQTNPVWERRYGTRILDASLR